MAYNSKPGAVEGATPGGSFQEGDVSSSSRVSRSDGGGELPTSRYVSDVEAGATSQIDVSYSDGTSSIVTIVGTTGPQGPAGPAGPAGTGTSITGVAVSDSQVGNDTRVSMVISFSDSSTSTVTFDVPNGMNGTNGTNGTNGKEISSISSGSASTSNGITTTPITVNFNDSSTASFNVRAAQGTAGAAGAQGVQGRYYVKLFLRSSSTPTTPTDVTWTPGSNSRGTISGNNSAGWSLTVPSGTDQLWEVENAFDPAGAATGITTWSSPFQAGAEGPAGTDGESYDFTDTSNSGTTLGVNFTVTNVAGGDDRVTATVDASGVHTDLGHTATDGMLRVTSSSGNNTDLPAATTTTWGVMTDEDKTKLDGIATGAEVNVQSDWDATSGDAFIQNKPSIPTVTTFDGQTSAGNYTVPVRDSGSTTTKFLREDGDWEIPVGTTYPSQDQDTWNTGTNTTESTITPAKLHAAIDTHQSTLSQEQVEDYVGGMVTGNTETGISVTYQDSDGTLDFVVNVDTDQVADNAITAAKLDVSGNGTSGQVLSSDGDGSFSWINQSSGGGGGGVTNLNAAATGTSLTIESSSGNNASIPAATTSAWGAMTDEDKTKLDGIATGAEVNVQSDWNQTTTTADDYIENKPFNTIGDGLEVSSNALRVDLDGTTIARGSNGISVADDAIQNSKLANMAGNTVKVNATANDANPTDLAISAGQVLGRDTSGNLTSLQVTEGMLDIHNSPTSGHFLQYDTTNGMQWAAASSGSIADDSIAEVKLDIPNAPFNAAVLGYAGGDWRWMVPTLGMYRGQWTAPNTSASNVSNVLTNPIGNGNFIIASAATEINNSRSYENIATSGENLSTIAYIALSTQDADGNDARQATGHLKNGSIIHIEDNADSTNYAFLEISSNQPFSSSGPLANFRQVTVLASGGHGPEGNNPRWNLTIRPAPFMPVANKDIADNAITTGKINDGAITNAKITNSTITGQKLNVTDPDAGTRISQPLYRDDDSGALHEAPLVLFSGSTEGIVPAAPTASRPDPDTLVNAIQTQPLRFTTNTQGIITGARGWELLHNGSVVTTRPTTWAGFDHSSDNVGLWITTEDLTQAERTRLTTYGSTLDTGTIEMLVVNAEDHNSWMLCNMRADLTESGDDTLETGDLGTGMYVSVGDGAFSVVSSQGTPSDNLKFYFPVSLTGTVDVSQPIPNVDRFIDASGNWVEPAINRLETLSDVLETQITPFRLVGYDTSSATLKYKQWDTKIDGHIYHYTVFYTFSSGVIQTAQVYQGHWTTVPTGALATSFLFGTRTYTTTNGVTTWSDSI